jgi:sugar/nucleoside kinase (ribokinase family)
MAADRGTARDLRPDEIEPAWLVGCTHLHVSGYALMVEPVRSAALRAVELGRGGGARVSLDLASWSAIRDSGVDVFREAAHVLRPDVVFANEDEERIVGRLDATWIRKRGAACSTPRVQATHSPRAGSWAVPTWRSRRQRAASSSWARCR